MKQAPKKSTAPPKKKVAAKKSRGK